METNEKTYMVLDLKDYSVSYLEDVPEDGWTEEYKTEKMVLRYIPAGTFVMGSPENELGRCDNETQHKVTLTRPFYMGVFPVTETQYGLITSVDSSMSIGGDMRPVETVSYYDLRGRKKGAQWPKNNSVDEDSFFDIFRAKTKLDFDLPTEAQWEYACRAGTTTALNNGEDITHTGSDCLLDLLGRYAYNNNEIYNDAFGTIEDKYVGLYYSNDWELYDMHGSVYEWCLDWYDEYPNAEVTDPKGAESGEYRVHRGGGWDDRAERCRSAYRCADDLDYSGYCNGFRVVLVL